MRVLVVEMIRRPLDLSTPGVLGRSSDPRLSENTVHWESSGLENKNLVVSRVPTAAVLSHLKVVIKKVARIPVLHLFSIAIYYTGDSPSCCNRIIFRP